ncbi:hypothetical protein Tco_1443369 [Tanacetum coccineum]
MLLYLWDGGLDVCVNLTRSSSLTQIGMTDFVLGRMVIDAAQRKRGKYMYKCAAIGYEFLSFSFSSLVELEADAVILLKRIRKFSITQDIGARAAVYILIRLVSLLLKNDEKVTKIVVLMDIVGRINDLQCKLLLFRACACISKLYFAMRACSPRVFEMAQCSFDAALRSALKRIVTASGPGLSHPQNLTAAER